MPTGYTDGVAKGEITDFKDYALMCARNFGACILLRDEPLNSEIPEFMPSDYYPDKIKECKEKLQKFTTSSDDSLRLEMDAEYKEDLQGYYERKEKNEITLARYNKMLEKAKKFKAPTEGHENYAKFLVSQLEESISFDCDRSWDKQPFPPFYDKWKKEKVTKLKKDLSYYEEEYEKEVKRTNERNEWVNALKQALAEFSQ